MKLKKPLVFLRCSSVFPPVLLPTSPGLNANEIQFPYDKHHKVSSLVKSHQNTNNYVKHEVI